MSQPIPEGILVLPHLRVQNANTISSPLTHGFPAITAFTGLMWALERKLTALNIPLHLQGVGVICHHHQEQISKGYVRTFNLTRNPVKKDGKTAAIAEEGRMHMEITLVFAVAEQRSTDKPPVLVEGAEKQMCQWAETAGITLSHMRIAGGSLLPSRPTPGKRVRPWLAPVAEDAHEQVRQFRRWRRQWLPGFALVGRDDLLTQRLQLLQEKQADANLLDAWLHAARFNWQATATEAPEGKIQHADGKAKWKDPQRPRGSGWTVPIPVGYAALSPLHEGGTVENARDSTTPLQFVESIYSLGEWRSPHRLTTLQDLLWHAEHNSEQGLYRCRSGYRSPNTENNSKAVDDDDVYII
ncbi:MAG: type I-F CRISPR-associated protein Csy2 [Parahaliea sp.]